MTVKHADQKAGGRDYGGKGRVGVATPQANPTVEPELAAALPPGVALYATRLVSRRPDPTGRMMEYYEQLDRTLDSYDTLKLDAFAFACTASSYLVGKAREDRDMAALAQKRGYPVVTGGQAILAALESLGVGRLAIGAPYPESVIDSCKAYYAAAGFRIAAVTRIATRSADTRTIYELSSEDAYAAAASMDVSGADCVLFTGSGMPSLRAIPRVQEMTGLPVLCTNLCLAWWLCKTIGVDVSGGPHKLINGWQDRLAQL